MINVDLNVPPVFWFNPFVMGFMNDHSKEATEALYNISKGYLDFDNPKNVILFFYAYHFVMTPEQEKFYTKILENKQ